MAMKSKGGDLFVRDAPEMFIGVIIHYLGCALKYFRSIKWKECYMKRLGNDDICLNLVMPGHFAIFFIFSCI